MWAVEATGLTKSYGPRPILREVSFLLAPGKGLCLFGPSGCGKSTLLRIVAGLERPDGGALRLYGETAADDKGAWLAPENRSLNLVFQDLALWPHLRAANHLHFVLRGRGLGRGERKRRVEALLALGGLTERARAYPAKLSGGEQQRLALMRTLATEPRLLLLDEPFSNLGADHIAPIKAEIRRRMTEQGLALIIATHHRPDAEGLAEQTLSLA